MGQKFGQHFLADKDVLDNIADAVLGLKKELGCTDLIEIGPGKGILTELIIQDFEGVKLLEVDSSLKPFISRLIDSHKNAEVIRGDVLKRESKDFESDKRPLVVGNLPYYITSPIFRKFFLEQSHIGGIFLIQNEVADKISTLAKKKSYLWWLLNYGYHIEYIFTVPAEAFDPPPKVKSAVISIKQKVTPMNRDASKSEKLKGGEIDFDRMVEFLDIVSMFSRKTLRKIWKMREEELKGFTLSEEVGGKRLEELDWEEMGEILGM